MPCSQMRRSRLEIWIPPAHCTLLLLRSFIAKARDVDQTFAQEMQHAEFPSCLRFSFTRNKLEKSRKPSSSACACLYHDRNRNRGNPRQVRRMQLCACLCLLCGRETHASTTQSDPLLLLTRNGPYRKDGAPRWEYLF